MFSLNKRRTSFSVTALAFFLMMLQSLILFSCSNVDYDGDILADIEKDSSSTVYFKKDAESPVAFSIQFEIGTNHTVADFPDKKSEQVAKLNPGFDMTGWKPVIENTSAQKAFTLDENGYIQAFHMTAGSLTVYGAGYTAAEDTPYKIIYKVQNLTMDGYDVHSEKAMTGTTSTPEAPSYTTAGDNLIEIEGFTALSDSIEEQEIAGDGTTVVEVLYNRNEYTLTLHKNDGNIAAQEEIVQVQCYYEVPKLIPANPFTYSGVSFGGWATSVERAAAGNVDYTDGVYYTIGAADADLYAVLILPQISVTIELPGLNEVGATYSISGSTLTLTAVLPTGAAVSDYTYKWFYPSEGISNTLSTSNTFTLNTSSWVAGWYQITLIAERVSDGMPSGITLQIHKE